jgi:hypothetical protein
MSVYATHSTLQSALQLYRTHCKLHDYETAGFVQYCAYSHVFKLFENKFNLFKMSVVFCVLPCFFHRSFTDHSLYLHCYTVLP